MQLLQPIYLLFLGGLLLPLAIHLWNKKQGKVIDMGTLRFLKELPKEQINSIQLTQKRLLVLRWLILILPILFLAGLVLQTPQKKDFKAWVLLSPELANDKRITAQFANYNQDSFQIFLSDKLLTPFDFEEENSNSHKIQPDYASLIERIDQISNKPDSLVIYTSAKIQDFSKVPYTKIPVNWVQIPEEGNELTAYTVAWNVGKDSIKLLSTISNSNYSKHSWQKETIKRNNNSTQEWQIQADSLTLPSGNSLQIQKTKLSILLIAKDTTSQGVGIIKAAFRTLNKYFEIHIKVKTLTYEDEFPKDADYYFLIDANDKVDGFTNSKTCLVSTGNLSMQKGFSVQEKGLLPKIYLDTDAERQDAKLVSYLANLLFLIDKNLASFDNRILDAKQLMKFGKPNNSDTMEQVNTKKQSATTNELNYYLLGICTILIALERWLSTTK